MASFSVIIPVYNIEKYLPECVKSVLEQTYLNFEIILVNDGSTDSSGVICDQLSESHQNVKVIHKTNGGLSSARNKGVKIAKGDYLMFLDGDDFIDRDSLKNFNSIINLRPGVELICGKFIRLAANGNLQKETFEFPFFNENMKGIDVLATMFEEVPVTVWSACRTIYKRDFFVNNRFKFKEGITSEDLELVPKIYKKANSVAANEIPFYYYRLGRENSIINTINSNRFYDIKDIIDEHIGGLKEDNIKFNKQFLVQLANIYARYVVLVSKVHKEERNHVINNMKELKWILKYSTGARGKYVSILTNILGFNLTSVLYNLMKRVKILI